MIDGVMMGDMIGRWANVRVGVNKFKARDFLTVTMFKVLKHIHRILETMATLILERSDLVTNAMRPKPDFPI